MLYALLLYTLSVTYTHSFIDGAFKNVVDVGDSASLNPDDLERIAAISAAKNPESNITAVKGGEVTLTCTLNIVPDSSVLWMDKMDNVLFFNQDRIIDDNRFDIMRGNNEWSLRIRNVSSLDGGYYRCAINTEPVQYKVYELIVLVPARIDKVMSSQNILADEGGNVSLICNASGFPTPKYTWTVNRADDSRDPQEIPGPLDGQILNIYSVQRHCDDNYTCMATNNLDYSDSHTINVRVQFPPNISLPKDILHQFIGLNTVLSCVIDAFPLGKRFPPKLMYWAKNGVQLKNSSKYTYAYQRIKPWRMVMRLSISSVDANDFGHYKCSATNSKGHDKKYTQLADWSKVVGIDRTKHYRPGSTRNTWLNFPSSTPAQPVMGPSPSKKPEPTPVRKPRPPFPQPNPQSGADNIGVISTLTYLLFTLSAVVVLL